MSDFLDLFESEQNSEFALSLEDCNSQKILDCFVKYNESVAPQFYHWDSQLVDEEIDFTLHIGSDELWLLEIENNDRLLNERLTLWVNQRNTTEEIEQKTKEEAKEETNELNLTLNIYQGKKNLIYQKIVSYFYQKKVTYSLYSILKFIE